MGGPVRLPWGTKMFQTLKKFNLTIWLIVVGAFASRFVMFMVWPYLAVILHDKFGLNPFEVGLFLTASGGVGTIFGFYVGYLSDQIGRRKIILLGVFVTIVSSAIMGMADGLPLFFAASLGTALARGMTEGPARALMTDMMDDADAKELSLHVRYFSLNVGAATGPLIGAAIGLSGHQTTFFWLAGVYAVYLVAAAWVFHIETPAAKSQSARFSFASAVRVLRADQTFLVFILAAFLGNLAYAQIDAGMVQYLQISGFENLVVQFAQMMAVNGTTIIILQFPLLALLKSVGPFARAQIGVSLFAAGFVGFGLAPLDTGTWLLVAMFVLSVGEAILFPTMNILIDRIAPKDMKGSYFGAAGLGGFGFVFAPVIGGAILATFGGFTLWASMAMLAVLVSGLYFRARSRAPLPA